MMTPEQLDAVIASQRGYGQRRRSNTNYVWNDEPELRAAWLKQLFASFDYHEKLITIHYGWMNYIKNAVARPYVREKFPTTYAFFVGTAIPNFENVVKPGQLDPTKWEPGKQAGEANTIGYYGHDTGLDMMHSWEWLTEDDRQFIFPLWGYMDEMCTNIQQTVNHAWEDDILNELYTGPIDWPSNWKDDLPRELVASAEKHEAAPIERVSAGKPCPHSGWWFTPAKANSRRHFKQGDAFPAIEGSAYGDTYWQWSPDQSAPSL